MLLPGRLLLPIFGRLLFKVTSEGEDTYVESGIADGWLVVCTKLRRIPNTNSFKEECCNEVHKFSARWNACRGEQTSFEPSP